MRPPSPSPVTKGRRTASRRATRQKAAKNITSEKMNEHSQDIALMGWLFLRGFGGWQSPNQLASVKMKTIPAVSTQTELLEPSLFP